MAAWLQGTWEWLKLGEDINDFHWMERATEHVMQYMEVRRCMHAVRGGTQACAGACKQDGTWMVENIDSVH